MRLGRFSTSAVLVLAVATLAMASPAAAQQRAGVVTTLEGKVTVARASLPELALLKFRDDVLVNDRITTGEKASARVLLGGRAVVTVRERSTVTITETPGVSTVDVIGGRVAVAVARERMRPGDLVEVRTPNAVAGIRGTVIVAEVWNSRSVITVLKGVIDVTRLDAGRVAGLPTIVSALQQVTVVGASPVPAPQGISGDAAQRMGAEFRMAPPKTAPIATTAAVSQGEVERTVRDLGVVTASAPVGDAGQPAASGDSGKADKADKSADKSDKKGGTATASTGGAPAASSSSSSSTSSGGSNGGGSASAASSGPAASSAPVASAPSAPAVSAPAASPAAAPVAVTMPTILASTNQAQSLLRMLDNFRDASRDARDNRNRGRDR
jgi:hypothetical protein